ncbi:MAG: polysaccharide biosynthesis C-terminal domain-containing protein [Bacilli bacterium]|nr:polysaccharide biosynthesis C-terminal domain-containing protein [Bacilli bacterium]
MKNVSLDQHFSFRLLLRAVIPSILMMIFTSIYSIVDGLFVSNFAGKLPFASINLIFPFVMVVGAIGFMMGTGGTALVCKVRGEGDPVRANKVFSLVVYATIAIGIAVSTVCIIAFKPIAIAMGATEEMLPYCLVYGRILLAGVTLFMLQNLFQSFLMAAERPRFGLWITIAAGVMNMVLDALLVGIFKLGIVGAAAATVSAEAVGALIPLFYFISKRNKSWLRLGRPQMDFKALGKTMWNGSSELVANIAMSLVSIAYNKQLMVYYGENGVAAYGVIMYVGFVFVAIFIGYSMGVAPIVSFNYGANNKKELNNLVVKSLIFMLFASIAMVGSAELLADLVAQWFTGYDASLKELTSMGMRVFFLGYAFCGYSIFVSSFFTALNNGTISAISSVSRSLVFELASVIVLPLILGPEWIFASYIVSEVLSLIENAIFLFCFNKKYGYFPTKEKTNATVR